MKPKVQSVHVFILSRVTINIYFLILKLPINRFYALDCKLIEFDIIDQMLKLYLRKTKQEILLFRLLISWLFGGIINKDQRRPERYWVINIGFICINCVNCGLKICFYLFTTTFTSDLRLKWLEVRFHGENDKYGRNENKSQYDISHMIAIQNKNKKNRFHLFIFQDIITEFGP